MMLMLAVLAMAAADPPSDDTAANLAGLQQMYDQSCAAREYGAYDDLCDQLAHQLKDARVEAGREARRKAAEARRHPHAPSPPQPPAAAGSATTAAAPS